VVSDEDESVKWQADDKTLLDPAKFVLFCTDPLVKGQPCSIAHKTSDKLLSYFKSVFPSKNLVVNSIVSFPKDATSADDKLKWDAACANSDTVETDVGCHYWQLSQSTKGKTVNIGVPTSETYTQYLTDLGTATRTLIRRADLDCAPYQGLITVKKKDGTPYPGSYTISGNIVEFTANLPSGDYVISYKCQLP
jgi:hypothetical protein